MNWLRNILFPPLCFSCEEPGDYLCIPCKKQLKPHSELCPFCHRVSPHRYTCLNCRASYPALQWIIICFQYTGVLKRLLRQFKYEHRHHISPFLAERMLYFIQIHPPLRQAYQQQKLYISYVPSHRYRQYFVRGYNQSQLLAQHIATALDIPCTSRRKKIRRTRSQMKLSRKKRLTNLVWAYGSVPQKDIQKDATLIIIDDITTTWSTLYELAEITKVRYPELRIRWLVLGRHGR